MRRADYLFIYILRARSVYMIIMPYQGYLTPPAKPRGWVLGWVSLCPLVHRSPVFLSVWSVELLTAAAHSSQKAISAWPAARVGMAETKGNDSSRNNVVVKVRNVLGCRVYSFSSVLVD